MALLGGSTVSAAKPAHTAHLTATRARDVLLHDTRLVDYRATSSTTTASPTTTTTAPPATTTTTDPPPPTTTTTTAPPATTTTTDPPPPTTTAPPTTTTTVPVMTTSTSGVATWYSEAPDGYCASPSLPFGTVLEVTDDATGASVTCTVDDREAPNPGRVVDMSPTGFAQLASLTQGVIEVTISW